MYYNVNPNALKNYMFERVMRKVIKRAPGMESTKFRANEKTIGPVSRFLGVTYDNVKESVFPGVESEPHYLLRGLINSIDSRVDHFFYKKPGFEATSQDLTEQEVTHRSYKLLVGMEKEEEKDDEGNPFGEAVTDTDIETKADEDESTLALMVSNLMKEIVKAPAEEVTELAEKVVELSKENNDVNKDIAEGDEEIFATEEPEGDGSDEGDNDDKGKQNKDGDDPFADTGDDGDGEGGNPFDDGDDSGDKGSDNPFDDKGDKKKGKKDKKEDEGTTDNPFEDNSDKDNKVGKENAGVKHISKLTFNSFGLEQMTDGDFKIYPFAGIENDTFNRFAKYVSSQLCGEELEKSYTNFGIESTEYKTARKTYAATAKEAMTASVATVLTASLLNIPVYVERLGNPSLFEN